MLSWILPFSASCACAGPGSLTQALIRENSAHDAHKGFCAEMKDFLHDQKQNGAEKWEIFKFNFVGLLLQICEKQGISEMIDLLR